MIANHVRKAVDDVFRLAADLVRAVDLVTSAPGTFNAATNSMSPTEATLTVDAIVARKTITDGDTKRQGIAVVVRASDVTVDPTLIRRIVLAGVTYRVVGDVIPAPEHACYAFDAVR